MFPGEIKKHFPNGLFIGWRVCLEQYFTENDDNGGTRVGQAFTDDELIPIIDNSLKEMDKDDDGFIDWSEFMTVRASVKKHWNAHRMRFTFNFPVCFVIFLMKKKCFSVYFYKLWIL